MATLRFLDSEISVVTQQKGNFCWAACIEMVTNKYHKEMVTNKLQCQLAQKLVALVSNAKSSEFDPEKCLECGDVGDTSLPKGDDLYVRLFKEICKINCTQIVSTAFPTWRSIKAHASNGSPVIFSGLYIPSCFGARHAVVVTGCFQEQTPRGKNINWVMANDPFAPNPCQGGKARKTAWMYVELKKSHHKVSTELEDMQPLSFVMDFKCADPTKDIETSDVHKKVMFTASKDKSTGKDGSYRAVKDEDLKKQVLSLLKSLFGNENDTALRDYFGFRQENIIDMSYIGEMVKHESINASDMSKFTVLPKDLKEIKEDVNISFLPIHQDGKPIIDICIQHRKDGKNRILGMQEFRDTDKIDSASASSGSTKSMDDAIIDFDHNAPNYKIVDIAPFGFRFMVFEWEGETYWAPVDNYPSIDCQAKISLSTSELMERLNKKIPSALPSTKPQSY